RVADDLDHLSVSRKRSSKGGGLKLDLDLPSAEHDDVPFGEGIRLPEWDYRKQALVEDYVLLQPMLPRDAEPKGLRSEEHTSELQSRENLVCRLLLEKKKNN